jgi:DNA-binding XRE family transcriptional regulator
MLEHTKARRTSDSFPVGAKNSMEVFRVICPVEHTDAVKQYLTDRGCTLEELVAPSTVFPERRPGTLLRGSRNREGLTQLELAEKCGISRHHISEMESGKRTIGKQNAAKLGSVLNVDPRLFL